MFTSIRNTVLGIAISVAAVAALPKAASAGDYCREYTRTVYIGARAQEAYGTACLQPDGSWMIVGEGLGNDITSNVSDVDYVIHDNRRDFAPSRVVYYERHPSYYRRPASPVFIWSINNGYYRRPASPVFIWSINNGYYRHGHHYNYRRDWDRRDRHDKWDRHDNHRGRGRGHGHH